MVKVQSIVVDISLLPAGAPTNEKAQAEVGAQDGIWSLMTPRGTVGTNMEMGSINV